MSDISGERWLVSPDDPSTVLAEAPGKPYTVVAFEATGYQGTREARAKLAAQAPYMAQALRGLLAEHGDKAETCGTEWARHALELAGVSE